MPIVPCKNRITGDDTLVYKAGMSFKCGGDWLLAERKKQAAAHQEMAEFQKQCASRRDVEGARFFKEEAAYHRRMYNALLYIIPWFVADPPKDCKPVTEPWYWPLDLSDEFDRLLSLASVSE